jgi:hypothetical protein
MMQLPAVMFKLGHLGLITVGAIAITLPVAELGANAASTPTEPDVAVASAVAALTDLPISPLTDSVALPLSAPLNTAPLSFAPSTAALEPFSVALPDRTTLSFPVISALSPLATAGSLPIAQAEPTRATPATPATLVAPVAQTPPSPATPSTKPIPTRIEIAPEGSGQVTADARSTLRLTGQIFDQDGNPYLDDVTVTLTSSAGKLIGADQDTDRPGFQVIARNGKFQAELQSSLDPQKVKIRAAADTGKRELGTPGKPGTAFPLPQVPNPTTPHPTPDRAEIETFAQVEFTPNLRPSLVSGLVNFRFGAAGSDFYDSFSSFLNPDNMGVGAEFKLNTSVFAIGTLGEWAFTGAYNNQRPLNQTCDGQARLFRDTQFCDQVYPVYGDSSTSDFLTPSIDSVYFRFERTSPVAGAGTDYFMWGDYRTEEFARTSQLYTGTTRPLHGFKANYNFGDLQATIAYGNNLQGFQRDTIAPNGTSGYYFLSRRLVLGGSETVYIETEELNRPGTVLERKSMIRTRDYEIDYDRGTILFRRPILQTEYDPFGRSLVRRIVVTYEFDGNGTGDTKLYAGRLQYNLSREFQKESWIAGSYLREDFGGRDFELYGADSLISWGKDGQLIAEFAQSSNRSPFLGVVSGNAYRVEAKGHLATGLLMKAYYRSVDENFTNNATFSYTPGQTRMGAQLEATLTPTTLFQVQYDRETNYGFATTVRSGFDGLFNPGVQAAPGTRLDNTYTTVSAGIQQRFGAAALSVDWVNRSRQDRSSISNFNADTNQLVSRLTVPLAKTLTFRAQNETSLGSVDPLYGDRTTVGLDWAAFPGVTLRLAQQFLYGSQLGDRSITSFDTLLDHRLSDDTSMTGRYSVLTGNSGWTGQGAIGLNHRLKIAPGLRANFSYERIFGDVFAYTAAGQQFVQPFAVGQSAATLGLTEGNSYSVGLDYTDNPDFKASLRYERRDAADINNTVISGALAGKVSPSLTALARFQQANSSNQGLTGLGDTKNIKVGLAYRDPANDTFNMLLRYEYRENPNTTPTTTLFGEGTGSKVHLGAIEAIYTPNFRWEFYGKYAIRSTRSYIASDLAGTNAISLAQLRATYKLGYNWDVGGEVRWIGQSLVGFNEVGFVVEAGYYLTPNLRLAAGYSFGTNDSDFDGRSKGGPYAMISLKLNELFSGFGLQRVAPKQQKESQLQPVATQPVTTGSAATNLTTVPGLDSGGR